MKTWQDLGEVKDSDDEDFDLQNPSQSPEPPAKKPRLDDGGERLQARRGSGLQNGSIDSSEKQHGGARAAFDAEQEWLLQPKLQTTYGKKTTHPGKTDSNSGNRTTPLEENEMENGSPLSSRPLQASVGYELPNPLPSSSSTNSEALPEVSQILAQNLDRTQKEHDVRPDLSSALSSPLSECDVSPPLPPAQFRSPTLGREPSLALPLSDNEHGHDQDLFDGTNLLEAAAPTTEGRRNFRTRQEKQLHPYMFDKAQYQRQCRDRGLRPVRYVEAEHEAEETQDASVSGDDSSSPPPRQSSPFNSELSFGGLQQRADKFEDFHSRRYSCDGALPDLPILDRSLAGGQTGLKRRKLSHVKLGHVKTGIQDEFSIPPSPPPTSSEYGSAGSTMNKATGFRMPHGLTPAPLPTPQISSDTRRLPLASEHDVSDTELPARRSRLSGLPEPDRSRSAVESTSESSGSDCDPGVQQSHLLRERKRIRGVLPASWLKIDFRAQQRQLSPSPTRTRQKASPSPSRSLQQKGVAQKVTRPRSPSRADVVAISDDESEPASLRGPPSRQSLRQLELQFQREASTVAPTDLVDEDRMEIDWIDPMLAGPSRNRDVQPRKNRQPRMTDMFDAVRERSVDFSEERRAQRQTRIETSSRRKKGTQAITQRRHRRNPNAYNLSIVDAPERHTTTYSSMPQFVRLAMRTAQARADHGRHSPSRKQIRLATETETQDAVEVLRGWREGTLAPRQPTADSPTQNVMDLTIAENEKDSIAQAPTSQPRLTDLSKSQQQKLPRPLRREVSDSNPKSRTVHVSPAPQNATDETTTSQYSPKPERYSSAVKYRCTAFFKCKKASATAIPYSNTCCPLSWCSARVLGE